MALVYGSLGRQVDEHVFLAWEVALDDDVTDYQVERAAGYLIRNYREQFPPTTAEFRQRALKYEPSEARERARLAHNEQALIEARK